VTFDSEISGYSGEIRVRMEPTLYLSGSGLNLVSDQFLDSR
jgi:hypothetical protein